MAVLDIPLPAHHLPSSIRRMRRLLPMSAAGVPARALRDPAVAAWVRAHGITVCVAGIDELEQTGHRGIRTEHVLVRCDAATSLIRAAVGAGVTRFVVCSDRHVDVLASIDHPDIAVYLDDRGPAVIGERRLQVVGLHADVDDSAGAVEWGTTAERLLCRAAVLRTCGLPLARISLAGGDISEWVYGDGQVSSAVAAEVDGALTDGCARWRLPRPSVLLGPAV
ncbi:MAG: hypothetical protein PGN37_00065 [Mycobacterium kyogaense]|uniref:hypothetical protein n=1 Tax=Mycobacterium kyogaense TaxID=2212479 RepID=UPI002FF7F929